MSNSRILGAVLAGGQSTRFGSNKALAMLDGETLLDHALARLAGWADAVIVVGDTAHGARAVPDWPRPGMGPLGGISAALRLARAEGFATVLTCGVDSLGLPDDLPQRLAPAPAYVADQPVVALWPATAVDAVERILAGSGRHSMRALAEAVGARAVGLPTASININTPEDLAAAQHARRRP